jgi:hypothetical protein
MSDRVETGSCFCGAITAEMQGEPFWICYDHDDDCRRAIGGAVNVWVGYRPDQVVITSGKPAVFSKTPGISRSFCATCGTSIAYQDEGIKDELYLTLGFFNKPEGLPPSAHAYWRLRLPWLDFADTLPRIEAYSRLRDPAIGTPAERAASRLTRAAEDLRRNRGTM